MKLGENAADVILVPSWEMKHNAWTYQMIRHDSSSAHPKKERERETTTGVENYAAQPQEPGQATELGPAHMTSGFYIFYFRFL